MNATINASPIADLAVKVQLESQSFRLAVEAHAAEIYDTLKTEGDATLLPCWVERIWNHLIDVRFDYDAYNSKSTTLPQAMIKLNTSDIELEAFLRVLQVQYRYKTEADSSRAKLFIYQYVQRPDWVK